MSNSLTFIADAWRFFKNNLISIITLIMPVVIPVSIFFALTTYYAQDIKRIEYLAMIPYVLTFPLYQCAFILYMSSVINGEVLPRKQYYHQALKLWPSLLGLYIITITAFITGFLLLVIPALIVMVRVSFSEFYCVFYKKSPVEAFILSWKATKEYQGVIFAGLVIIWLVTNVPFWVTKRLFSSMELWNPITIALYNAAESLLAVLLTIFNFRIFSLLPKEPEDKMSN
jgi:hypothetical protein